MPNYTYMCQECGVFDYAQSIHDDSISFCPQCNADVKKVFSAAGIQFKGKGFYSTDSRGK
jgi:putative FmdB family regulatory protein